MRRISALIVVLLLAGLACGTTQTPAPTQDVGALAAQTLAAYTAEAALTLAAVPSETVPAAPPTSMPPAPEETAPNPLPMTHTGIILVVGECLDFDDGSVSPADGQCDLLHAEAYLMRQMNTARISGYASRDVPTRTDCSAARYEPGDLAAQSDLYMCFTSSDGMLGFVVVRQDAPTAPANRIIVDYWVFR